MQDSPPPGVAQDSAVAGPETLTAEMIESVLGDFRRWLQELASSAPHEPNADSGEVVGLHALVSQFVALRHDVNLQTKAARLQQEQASRSLDALEQALESLQA